MTVIERIWTKDLDSGREKTVASNLRCTIDSTVQTFEFEADERLADRVHREHEAAPSLFVSSSALPSTVIVRRVERDGAHVRLHYDHPEMTA